MDLNGLIFIICAGYFINSAGTTVPSPFFGLVAQEKGWTENDIGYMFSSFFIGNLISTIIIGV